MSEKQIEHNIKCPIVSGFSQKNKKKIEETINLLNRKLIYDRLIEEIAFENPPLYRIIAGISRKQKILARQIENLQQQGGDQSHLKHIKSKIEKNDLKLRECLSEFFYRTNGTID